MDQRSAVMKYSVSWCKCLHQDFPVEMTVKFDIKLEQMDAGCFEKRHHINAISRFLSSDHEFGTVYDLRQCNTLPSFKSHLKTHYFRIHMDK